MKAIHKARKLWNGEAWRSAREHLSRWMCPVDAAAMLRRVDLSEISRLRAAYPDLSQWGVHNAAKFTDAPAWIKINVERAKDLRLDRSPALRVLDLGCGPGYFLFVCRCLGHEGLGLDIDEMPLFRETTALLGVPRKIWRIEPMRALPDFGERFDLVTAHRICFHKVARADSGGGGGEWSQWGLAEWNFFLRDVRARVLKADGRLLLDFNPRPNGTFYSQAVSEIFKAQGGAAFRSKVSFRASPPSPKEGAAGRASL